MKRYAVLLLAGLAFVALPLRGSISGQVDLVSRYIWRGFDLLPDNHAAIQPSVDFEFGKSGFSLNVWSSFSLAQRDAYKYLDEIDLTLTYSFRMPEGWDLVAGFTHYGYWFAQDFTFKDSTTQELFATVTRTDLPLSPSLSVYYDLNLGSGVYVALGGSHEVKLGDQVALELSGLIGYNGRQFIQTSGLSNVDFRAAVPFTVGSVTLTPSANVTIPLMDEVNDATEIWFGLSVAIE